MTEGEQRFFFHLLEMGHRINRAEALREQAEGVVSKLRLVLDVMRAELDEAQRALAEATTETSDLHLQNFSVKASIRCLFNQAREETCRLLFYLGVVRAELDEVVDSVVATREEALWFSTEFVGLSPRLRLFIPAMLILKSTGKHLVSSLRL
ncbi:hypothetical protein ACLOJK_038880 [Asimina triloba]